MQNMIKSIITFPSDVLFYHSYSWNPMYLKVMKHYFMFVYMVYSLKMVSTKDHRGLWLVDWYAYLR